jgi:2,3-bisphosphoglycerate-dependent phosphoglycerate mutase
MRTKLYFVRHAHSIYLPDERSRPLSERGHNDAKHVAELLKNEQIDHIISSPYKRAQQTVEGLAKNIAKEIIVEEDFKERVLSGKPVEDFNEAISRVWEDKGFSWEGGESNITAQNRGIKGTKEILNRFAGKNIVIGTHGNMMVLIMNYFDPQYDFTFWRQLDMPDIYRLTFHINDLMSVDRLWDRKGVAKGQTLRSDDRQDG